MSLTVIAYSGKKRNGQELEAIYGAPPVFTLKMNKTTQLDMYDFDSMMSKLIRPLFQGYEIQIYYGDPIDDDISIKFFDLSRQSSKAICSLNPETENYLHVS